MHIDDKTPNRFLTSRFRDDSDILLSDIKVQTIAERFDAFLAIFKGAFVHIITDAIPPNIVRNNRFFQFVQILHFSNPLLCVPVILFYPIRIRLSTGDVVSFPRFCQFDASGMLVRVVLGNESLTILHDHIRFPLIAKPIDLIQKGSDIFDIFGIMVNIRKMFCVIALRGQIEFTSTGEGSGQHQGGGEGCEFGHGWFLSGVCLFLYDSLMPYLKRFVKLFLALDSLWVGMIFSAAQTVGDSLECFT